MSRDMHFKMRLFPLMMLASCLVGPSVQLTCDPFTQYEKNGECCILCGPGTSMTEQSTCAAPQCEACKENEYQDAYTQEGRCKRQPYCDPNKNFEVPVEDGSKTKERTCVCKRGFHCSNDVCLSCVPHTPCDPGYEALAEGSPTSDTVCRPCPKGTFSDVTSFNSECVKWTECAPGHHIRNNGTAVSDVVCGETPRTHIFLWIGLVLLFLLVAVALFYYRYRRHVQNKMKHYFCDDLHHGDEDKTCTILNIEPNRPETPILRPEQESQDEASSQVPVEDMDEETQGPGNYTDNGNCVVQERGKSDIVSRQESQTCTFTDSMIRLDEV